MDFLPKLLHVLYRVSENRSLVHFRHERHQRSEYDEPLVELLAAAAFGEDVVGAELVLRRSLAEPTGGVAVAGFRRVLVAVLGVEEGNAKEDVFEQPLGGALHSHGVVVMVAAGSPLGKR